MKNLLCCLLVCIPFLLFAQSLDSFPKPLEAIPQHLEYIMNMTEVSEEQIKPVLGMFADYANMDEDSTALLIARKMEHLTRDYPDNNNKTLVLNMCGLGLMYTGDREGAVQYFEQTKKLASELENDLVLGTVFKNLGKINWQKEQYDEAFNNYLNSIKSYERIKDSTRLFRAYYSMAGLYFRRDFLEKTEEYTAKAAVIAEAIGNDKMKSDIYSIRGNIFNKIAGRYHNKAKNETTRQKVYMDSSRYFTERSLENIKLGLEIDEKYGRKKSAANTLTHMVAAYNNLDNYDEALRYGKRAKKLIDELGDDNMQSQLNNYLAISYLKKGDYEQALICGKKSMETAQQLGSDRRIGLSHDYLSTVYEELGQYKKALEHLQAYDRYLLEVNSLEKVELMTEAEAKYETVKQEKQILEQENEILELETNNTKIKTQRNGIIGGSILLAVLGFLVYNFFKIRKDRNDKKTFAEALISAQETERKRIARDLHDGVGQSLLLIKKQLAVTHETTSENSKLINNTLEEVRTISRDLHPFQLEKFGLTTAIHDVIERVEKSTDLFITKEIESVDGIFSEKNDIHYFRAIQEALNNIVKHADASAAKIIIKKTGNDLVTKVMDNGKGFDHELTVITSKSLGLRTMNERISTLGGRLKIESNDPSGTIVNFTIPKTT